MIFRGAELVAGGRMSRRQTLSYSSAASLTPLVPRVQGQTVRRADSFCASCLTDFKLLSRVGADADN